jgi:hypothetical protein
MKKFLAIIMLCLVTSGLSYSAVKFNLFLANPRYTGSNYVTFDVMVNVLSGQQWRVGSSNIRIDWFTIPANGISIRAENPAFNPNTNIHGNSSYAAMTTTSILGGGTISLNISWNTTGPCYRFNPGTYTLGSIRFNRLDTNACIRLNFRTNCVVQDSITQCLNPADWTFSTDTTCYRLNGSLGTSTAANEIPNVFRLYTNYPNPFNPSTMIKFDIPKGTHVTLSIYDILGKEVDKLVNGYVQPGSYEVLWDASNYASGTYFYRFESGSFTDLKKMVLVK